MSEAKGECCIRNVRDVRRTFYAKHPKIYVNYVIFELASAYLAKANSNVLPFSPVLPVHGFM